jgi:hypothetical protein
MHDVLSDLEHTKEERLLKIKIEQELKDWYKEQEQEKTDLLRQRLRAFLMERKWKSDLIKHFIKKEALEEDDRVDIKVFDK